MYRRFHLVGMLILASWVSCERSPVDPVPVDAGSVVVDVYFSTGGLGSHFVNAALNRDYSTMMGVTILLGVLTVTFNLIVDILYAWIDPKIRY